MLWNNAQKNCHRLSDFGFKFRLYFLALRLDNIEFILCFKSILVAAEHLDWAMVDGGFILVDLPRNLLVQSSCGLWNWKGRSAMLFAKSFSRRCKNEGLYTPDAILVHANDLHWKNKSIFTQNGNIVWHKKRAFTFQTEVDFTLQIATPQTKHQPITMLVCNTNLIHLPQHLSKWCLMHRVQQKRTILKTTYGRALPLTCAT